MSSTTKLLFGIVAGSLVVLLAAAFLLSKTTGEDSASQPPVQTDDVEALVRDDSYKIATESATVTLVEFSDFQCPSCAQAHPVVKRILAEYPEDVSFVYRHFPLTQAHKNAEQAALAAEAAGVQGKFFEMEDILFERQKDWADERKPEDTFAGYAGELELDVDQFTADIKSKELLDKINRDVRDGFAVGVNSTPTFFANGQKVPSWSYERFKSLIDNVIEMEERGYTLE